jgi:ribonucleotide reductase alpha subunit
MNKPCNLSANGLKVLRNCCLHRISLGRIVETPGQIFRRVAKTMASAAYQRMIYEYTKTSSLLAQKFPRITAM